MKHKHKSAKLPKQENTNMNIEDAKQQSTNGILDQLQIIDGGADTTDEASHHSDILENFLTGMLAKGDVKKKCSTFDNCKRNRINLTPLESNGIKIEDFIKQKTGLTRTGLLSILFFIFLTTILLVCLVLWTTRRIPECKEYSVCAKPSCLRSSAEIISKLNSNESACDNFKNYACGRLLDSNQKDHNKGNLKELLQFQYRQKVHQLIHGSPVVPYSSSLLWKLKCAYDSCLKVDQNTDKKLRSELRSITGQDDVLNGFSSSSWNLQKFLIMLHSRLSISPFFTIDVIPDVRNYVKHMIRLQPPQLGLPNKKYHLLNDNDPVIELYKNYIKDIFQLFGDTTSVDAAKFGETIFYFEKRLDEILIKDDEAQAKYARIAIGDLSKILPADQIPLYEILNATFPEANIKNADYVLVSSISYFRNLAEFVNLTDPRILNDYLIWHVISEYLPYFPQQYVDTMNLFKKEVTGASEEMPRWEFCIATLQKFAGFGLLSLYENELIEQDENNSVVIDLFNKLLSVVKEGILSNQKNGLQSHLLEKLNRIEIQTGLPAFMLQQKYVDSYYSELSASSYSLYDSVQYGIKFIRNDMQRRLIRPQKEYRWIDNMALNPTSITFNFNGDKVIVPSAALQRPFFEKEYALPILYGGIGTEIAKAIISGILTNIDFYENNKTINPGYINNSNRNNEANLLQYASDCILHRHFANFNVTKKQSIIANLIGIKYAHKSLTNELSNLNIQTRQPALETFENEKLFFIVNMQSLCSMNNMKKENHANSYLGIIAKDELLSKAIATYSTEFIESFSCKQKSMNYESSLCTYRIVLL